MKKLTSNIIVSCAIGGVAFVLYAIRDAITKGDEQIYLEGEDFYDDDSHDENIDDSNEDDEFKIDDSDIDI
ncbi:MAG: hypothetical protein ACRCX2_32070 [Paraclostridium sp.]